MRKGGLQKKKA